MPTLSSAVADVLWHTIAMGITGAVLVRIWSRVTGWQA